MKIRNGFVSNSSTSSFIIAFKDSEVCPHCGRKDPNILAAIEQSYGNDDNRVDSQGEAVLEYVKSNYAFESPEILEKLNKQIKQHIDEKYTVACISISYHDELLNSIFKNGSKSGNIKILRE